MHFEEDNLSRCFLELIKVKIHPKYDDRRWAEGSFFLLYVSVTVVFEYSTLRFFTCDLQSNSGCLPTVNTNKGATQKITIPGKELLTVASSEYQLIYTKEMYFDYVYRILLKYKLYYISRAVSLSVLLAVSVLVSAFISAVWIVSKFYFSYKKWPFHFILKIQGTLRCFRGYFLQINISTVDTLASWTTCKTLPFASTLFSHTHILFASTSLCYFIH